MWGWAWRTPGVWLWVGRRGPLGCALQEADTDDHQGTLGFEEFCAFYKMMSTRRDLYLLMLTYSDHKDHLDAADLQRFLEAEQKVRVPRVGVLAADP